MIEPGAMLGVIGGGQLGRYFVLTARRMGYRTAVLDPDPDSPAGAAADMHLAAAYDSPQALDEMARRCAAVTVEFENVPAGSIEYLAGRVPTRPGAAAVSRLQNRISEKEFLREQGLATAPWTAVRCQADLEQACSQVALPGLLKRAVLGYDGKGQIKVGGRDEARDAFQRLGGVPCVLEQWVDLTAEISVVLARGEDGAVAAYPIIENRHRHGILHASRIPARVSSAIEAEARAAAEHIARAMDYVGVLAVEFFLSGDRLLVNEVSPRPHNSGHCTLDACVTSQFEQQLRALCGLPLGEARSLAPAVMINLLGDLWQGGAPRWDRLLGVQGAKLHLYGKQGARPGRKMGHITCLGESPEAAESAARTILDLLRHDDAPVTGP